MIHLEFGGNRLTFEAPMRDVTIDLGKAERVGAAFDAEPKPGNVLEVLPGFRVKVDVVARTPSGWRAKARWVP